MLIIIASWFQARRGLAMGIAFAGSTLGGVVMAVVANYAVAAGGWRVGYVTIGLPILVVVVPLIVIFIRTRNAVEIRESSQAMDGIVRSADEPWLRTSLPGTRRNIAGSENPLVLDDRDGSTHGWRDDWNGSALHRVPDRHRAYPSVCGYRCESLPGGNDGWGAARGTICGSGWARSAMIATYILAALGMIGMLTASHPLDLRQP